MHVVPLTSWASATSIVAMKCLLYRAGGRPLSSEQKKRPHDHPPPFSVMSNVNNKLLCLVTKKVAVNQETYGKIIWYRWGARGSQ
jgi:hypothetical protein